MFQPMWHANVSLLFVLLLLKLVSWPDYIYCRHLQIYSQTARQNKQSVVPVLPICEGSEIDDEGSGKKRDQYHYFL